MKKSSAIIQIVIVSFAIIYGTVSFFLGNFAGAFATLPFLAFCYVYLVARQRRQKDPAEDDDNEPKGGPGNGSA
ncbi:MAG: hypothetical protein AB9866_19165 [Syntrophobacteraceae bacterium]